MRLDAGFDGLVTVTKSGGLPFIHLPVIPARRGVPIARRFLLAAAL